jgi:hypothetical protein
MPWLLRFSIDACMHDRCHGHDSDLALDDRYACCVTLYHDDYYAWFDLIIYVRLMPRPTFPTLLKPLPDRLELYHRVCCL